MNVFERAYNANKSVTDRVRLLFAPVLEARDDANQTRNEYTTEENIRNLERLLRDRGLLREGSYLARDMQRILDSLRSKRNNGSVAEIPGEYRRMYDKIDEYEKSGKFPIPKGHSIRQGVFSIARSMDELKAEVKEAFPGAKVQEQGNKLIFTMFLAHKKRAHLMICPLSMSSPVSLLFTNCCRRICVFGVPNYICCHSNFMTTTDREFHLCFIYICCHRICVTVMATRTRTRKNFSTRYLIHFHIIHLVHELFHFIFLLTILSVVFVAFWSLYPRSEKSV